MLGLKLNHVSKSGPSNPGDYGISMGIVMPHMQPYSATVMACEGSITAESPCHAMCSNDDIWCHLILHITLNRQQQSVHQCSYCCLEIMSACWKVLNIIYCKSLSLSLKNQLEKAPAHYHDHCIVMQYMIMIMHCCLFKWGLQQGSMLWPMSLAAHSLPWWFIKHCPHQVMGQERSALHHSAQEILASHSHSIHMNICHPCRQMHVKYQQIMHK